MPKSGKISEVWLKASILGATWAASEIILGSFLHNLRIPFNGNILTAIGFILLISASYKWKDKGLFWRSGLICALMKTMSPSAIIFGPMIAIFVESVLLETSVRLFGRNLVGFLIGSALAMSWILVQKIANFIIFYGFNIVDIYTQLMGFAEKQLKIQFDLVWMPIVILLIIYILFGIVAVLIGMKIGKSLLQEKEQTLLAGNNHAFDFTPDKSQTFPYSIPWLAFDFIILVGMLFLINRTPIYVWTSATIILIFIWTQRYKRGLRQLSKPSFWIFFIVITMLSAFVVTAIQGHENKWMQGLIIGLQMNFRAAVVVVGFAVLGTELYNPKIRNFFAKTHFRQLPIALELAFESLPYVISHLPDVKSFFRKPVLVVKNLIYQAEKRFEELENQHNQSILILAGTVAEGKTRFLEALIPYLKTQNVNTTGFYTPRIMENDQTTGYDLVSLKTGNRMPFLRTAQEGEKAAIGKFVVHHDTLTSTLEELKQTDFTENTLVIIDEVGKWELQDKGWHELISFLSEQPKVTQLWAVRKEFVPAVIEKFHLRKPILYQDLTISAVSVIGNEITQKVNKR